MLPLYVQASVPLASAVCSGATIDVPALDGRVLRVPLKEVSDNGESRCLLM